MPSTTPIACVGPKRVVWALQVSFFYFLFFCIVFSTPTDCVHHPRHIHDIYHIHTAPTACVGPKRLVWALQVIFFSFHFFYCFFDTHGLRTPPATPTCHLPHPYSTHSLRKGPNTPFGPYWSIFLAFIA